MHKRKSSSVCAHRQYPGGDPPLCDRVSALAAKRELRFGAERHTRSGQRQENELLCSFKTIKAIKNAGLDELSAVVPKNTAKAVFEYYHKDEEKK